MVLQTNDTTFKDDVLKADVPVLVDFWAPWCGPCQMVSPIIDNLGKRINGNAKIYKFNVDENPETTSKYGIMSIPTVILFKNGQIDKQFIGVQSEQVYFDALNSAMQ